MVNRIIALLRQHPVLFLPVLLADVAAFGLNQGRHLAQHGLAKSYVSHASVLGNPTHGQFLRSVQLAPTVFLGGAVSLLSFFLSCCSYTAALVLISALLMQLRVTRGRPLHAAIHQLWQQRGRVLRFSGLFFAMYALIAVLAEVLIFAVPHWHGRASLRSQALLTIVACEFILATIWIGPTLKLLQGSDVKITLRARRDATLYAILLVLVEALFPALKLGDTGGLLCQMLASLVAALPFIPFFIALSLIAIESEVT